MIDSLKLSIGAVPYFWPREIIWDFYRKLAASTVDCIYIGETVCSKRRELGLSDWLEIARMLAAAGKEVVLSTLTLIEARSELSVLRKIAANEEFMIEANDLAGIEIAASLGRPFVTGPTVNIYNGRTLSALQRKGLVRWVPPVEISGNSIREILEEFDELNGAGLNPGNNIETEIFVYGRLPLAHSARCFTARYHDRPKDACGFVCIEHAEGLRASTRDDEPFLRLNGIQVQSDAIHCVQDMDSVVAAGATAIRLSPTGHSDATGFFDAISFYRDLLDGVAASLGQENLVSGYWTGQPGMNSAPGG